MYIGDARSPRTQKWLRRLSVDQLQEVRDKANERFNEILRMDASSPDVASGLAGLDAEYFELLGGAADDLLRELARDEALDRWQEQMEEYEGERQDEIDGTLR